MARFKRGVVAAVVLSAVAFGATSAVRQQPAAAQQERKASAKFEVYQDKSGGFRWRLRSQNRQILATSGEGYKDKRDCLSAIDSVKRAAADAPVEEMPAEPAK